MSDSQRIPRRLLTTIALALALLLLAGSPSWAQPKGPKKDSPEQIEKDLRKLQAELQRLERELEAKMRELEEAKRKEKKDTKLPPPNVEPWTPRPPVRVIYPSYPAPYGYWPAPDCFPAFMPLEIPTPPMPPRPFCW